MSRIQHSNTADQCKSQVSIFGKALKRHKIDKFKVNRRDVCIKRRLNEPRKEGFTWPFPLIKVCVHKESFESKNNLFFCHCFFREFGGLSKEYTHILWLASRVFLFYLNVSFHCYQKLSCLLRSQIFRLEVICWDGKLPRAARDSWTPLVLFSHET